MSAYHQQKRYDHGNRKWNREHAEKFRQMLRGGMKRDELCEQEGISRRMLQRLLTEYAT